MQVADNLPEWAHPSSAAATRRGQTLLLGGIQASSLVAGRRFFRIRMRELLARNTDELVTAGIHASG